MIKFLSRIALVLLFVIYWVAYPIVQLCREARFAWGNWHWSSNIKNEMTSNWSTFIHDFKLGRLVESKEDREKRIQEIMNDL